MGDDRNGCGIIVESGRFLRPGHILLVNGGVRLAVKYNGGQFAELFKVCKIIIHKVHEFCGGDGLSLHWILLWSWTWKGMLFHPRISSKMCLDLGLLLTLGDERIN